MMSSKKLFKMASKWENLSVIKRKRISESRNEASDGNSTSLLGQKGHFVVYTADQKRFLIPLVYLNKNIFRELLKLAEEEFGLEIDGPITLPCDATVMEYVVLLVERGVAENLEKALLMSVNSSCCSSLSLSHGKQQALCSY